MLNSKTTTTVRIAQTEYLLNCSSSMYMTSETMAKDKPALTAKRTLRRSERPISYNLEAKSLDQLWKLTTRSESASRKERLGEASWSPLKPTKSWYSFLERSLSLLFSKKLCLNDPTLVAILSRLRRQGPRSHSGGILMTPQPPCNGSVTTIEEGLP